MRAMIASLRFLEKNHQFECGTKPSNLASHLKSIHPSTLYAEKLFDEKTKEPLPLQRLRIFQNAVEIISVNGRPFSW